VVERRYATSALRRNLISVADRVTMVANARQHSQAVAVLSSRQLVVPRRLRGGGRRLVSLPASAVHFIVLSLGWNAGRNRGVGA
jgi:hypothetical protein